MSVSVDSIAVNEHCITSCVGMADGDYPSCIGCNMYVTCSGGNMADHVCPSAYFWLNGSCAHDTHDCDTRRFRRKLAANHSLHIWS